MGIKKTLVFYFYTFPQFFGNKAIRIHLYYINKYSHLFDDAVFVISSDKYDENLVKETKIAILENLHSRNATFKWVENDGLCESMAFKTEILDKLEQIDGLVFFGHTKGVTNFKKYPEESIKLWISGLWYYNLEHIDDVVDKLVYNSCNAFYGAFLHDDSKRNMQDNFNANKTWYCGTFYWINTVQLHNILKERNDPFDTKCGFRHFAEMFPGNICKRDRLKSYLGKYVETGTFNTYIGNLVDYTKNFGDVGEFSKEFCDMQKKLGF